MAREEVTHGFGSSGDRQQLIEMQIDGACEYCLSILDRSTHAERELGLCCRGASRAAPNLGAMFSDLHASFADVEDLSADAGCERAVLKMRAALHAGCGRMDDDLIWLCDLS